MSLCRSCNESFMAVKFWLYVSMSMASISGVFTEESRNPPGCPGDDGDDDEFRSLNQRDFTADKSWLRS